MLDVLLLDADYAPVRILAWERAVCLLLERKVHAVANYADRSVRSPTRSLPWPAVVSHARYVGVRGGPRLTRRHVLARDGFSCQYCGAHPPPSELTLDHVVPRSRAVRGQVTLADGRRVAVHSWANLVAACAACNHRKGDRTPEEAGLVLRTRPGRPSSAESLRLSLARRAVPQEWRDFL